MLADVDVSNNGDAGIQGISSALDISGGTVEANARLGVETFVDPIGGGTSQLSISGTRVCGNRGSGVGPQDTTVVLTDATLCTNTADGLHQTGGTLQMLRTSAEDNQGRGLSVNAAGQATLQDSMVSDNGDNGAQIPSECSTIGPESCHKLAVGLT